MRMQEKQAATSELRARKESREERRSETISTLTNPKDQGAAQTRCALPETQAPPTATSGVEWYPVSWDHVWGWSHTSVKASFGVRGSSRRTGILAPWETQNHLWALWGTSVASWYSSESCSLLIRPPGFSPYSSGLIRTAGFALDTVSCDPESYLSPAEIYSLCNKRSRRDEKPKHRRWWQWTLLSHGWLCERPLSIEFSRPEYWSG